ncbi:cytochrome-c peroxidase [Niastella yeongjuensis]|nr:cytochrome c peroxidase [Niastella yeongjuensis]SEP36097.1 cytochrome c peroxidase [Niastella yeongjuensis]
MRLVRGILGICFCLAVLQGLINPGARDKGVEPAVAYFREQSRLFALSAAQLQSAVTAIRPNDSLSVIKARNTLIQCRIDYKRIEYFLEYFFTSSAMIYNRAPKYEIEEPYMEYQEPVGLQVIESLLYEKEVAEKKTELLQQADAVQSSAADLGALLYGFKATDRQLLESMRLELIRVITLHISGYDAPFLKSGIAEAAAALEAIQETINPFVNNTAAQGDSVAKYLSGSIAYLHQHPDFDRFNRLNFLSQWALPLQRYFGKLVSDAQLELNTTSGVLNYKAADLFSPDALNLQAFPGGEGHSGAAWVQLGKQLFFEPGLSGNNKVSCATCHNPAKHFTDGLAQSVAFDGHSHVQRNASSLLYAGYQYGQFWDGRAKSLEEQVKTVMNNKEEMNGGETTITSLLTRKPSYKTQLSAFTHDSVTVTEEVAMAVAAYVRSLNPRNARFDQYLQGNTTVMTTQEINGFNLFMGKAQCGTCHFAPLFNGLTPPLYNLSELEVLGTTSSDNLEKPALDSDEGRLKIFPIAFYDKAFKTPTVRNVSATAPYMHNGAFKTLEAVIEFYNKGGAVGMGLPLPNQTLSAQPLNLSKEEVKDIVSFLHTLEDKIPN